MRYWLIMLLIFFLISGKSTLAQESRGSTDDFIVEAYISNNNPYVGEQILYVFRYLAYVLPPDITDNLPDFEGFWLSDVYKLSDNRVETINGRQYIVYEVYAEISPLDVGEIIIEPSILNIPETVFRSGIRLLTETITINVKPLPPDAPEEFTGAVGQFNTELNFHPSTITLGEPITMTITVDGTGALEPLPAPQLPPVDGWRIYAYPSKYIVSPVGGLRFGQKIFEWLLIPERAGTQAFPSIVFTSFDPQLGTYHSTILPAFTIEAFPGEGGISVLASASQVNPTSDILSLKPNLQSSHLIPENLGLFFCILWAVSPGIFVFTAIYTTGRKMYIRRRKQYLFLTAAIIARVQLEASLKYNSSAKVSQMALQAVFGYLAHKSGVNKIKSHELKDQLQAYHIRNDLIQALQKNILEIEAFGYIPANVEYDMSQVITDTYKTITAIDNSWLPG